MQMRLNDAREPCRRKLQPHSDSRPFTLQWLPIERDKRQYAADYSAGQDKAANCPAAAQYRG
jgi:hypothetical protein